MKQVRLLNMLKVLLVVAAGIVSAAASAAPIFSETYASPSSNDGAAGAVTTAAEAPLFSNMRLNGGQNSTVAFISDDNSILIGHYARGPWDKAEYLRSWQDGGNGNGGGNGGGGRGDFLPPVETVTGLPEPSTFALLALGLLALGAMRRLQTNH